MAVVSATESDTQLLGNGAWLLDALYSDLRLLQLRIPTTILRLLIPTTFGHRFRVHFGHHDVRNTIVTPLTGGRQTNNRAHMWAIIHALQVWHACFFALLACRFFWHYLPVTYLDLSRHECASEIVQSYHGKSLLLHPIQSHHYIVFTHSHHYRLKDVNGSTN